MIYCCGCKKEVNARQTTDNEVYSNGFGNPIWICDDCGSYVGTHHKCRTAPTRPLGVLATPEMRNARKHLHALIDPLWKSGRIKRIYLYRLISDKLGYEYHTAELRTIEEARRVWRIIREIQREKPSLRI